MSNNKYTIKDIAKYANVGTTTVSRVLNNHPYVSDAKRERVLRAMEELNYRQNLGAKWLRGASTGLIGFLTDDVATTPYAVDIIRGAQDVASQHDYVLLVVNAGKDLASTEAAIEFLLERQVVGIVYAAMFHRQVYLPDNIYQVKTALANCYVGDRSLPSAVPDEYIGGYRATRTLLEAGHRRIGFLNVIAPATDASIGRLAGYQDALKASGITFDPSLLGDSTEDADSNYEAVRQLMALDDPPSAFFFGNDRTALTGYLAINYLGLRISEEISVVGFDNQVDIAINLLPKLTTLQLPHYEMGAWALEQVLSDDEDKPAQVKIDCALIERDSVAPYRVNRR